MNQPTFNRELKCVVVRADDPVTRTDDCEHHFYQRGGARLAADATLGDGTPLAAGDYGIVQLLSAPVGMLVLPVGGAGGSAPADALKDRAIRVMGIDCNHFAAVRIPAEIRSESDNRQLVAPFHLRDPETDEEPEEFGQLEEIENLFTSYAAAEAAARRLATLTAADVSVCNGYSNTAETISPEDETAGEAVPPSYLTSESVRVSAPPSVAAEPVKLEKRDDREIRNETGDLRFASPPCAAYAPQNWKFVITGARADGGNARAVGACVVRYDAAAAANVLAEAENALLAAASFDALEGNLPVGIEARFVAETPAELRAAAAFAPADFNRLCDVAPADPKRLRFDGGFGIFSITCETDDAKFWSGTFHFAEEAELG